MFFQKLKMYTITKHTAKYIFTVFYPLVYRTPQECIILPVLFMVLAYEDFKLLCKAKNSLSFFQPMINLNAKENRIFPFTYFHNGKKGGLC